MFIAFEGIDGCGKTTLSKKIASMKMMDWTKEPTFSSDRSNILNRGMLDSMGKEVEFIVDRFSHQEMIKKTENVVCDRYLWSGIAYCRVFNPSAYEFSKALYGHPFFRRPDCYVFVDAPVEVCYGRRRDQTKEQLRRLREAFLLTQKIVEPRSKVITIVNVGDIDDVTNELLRKLGRQWSEMSERITQECLSL